jgi:hypothetical protein
MEHTTSGASRLCTIPDQAVDCFGVVTTKPTA